nr:ORF6N domain-containing protein [Thermoanaerobaculia bacterium]
MTEVTAVAIDVGTRIQSIRGLQVLLDSDLAAIYGVSTKAFNQAVKRGAERFPKDFAFQLSEEEFARLRSQIV